MCVYLEDYDTKIVKLPAFPVTATRLPTEEPRWTITRTAYMLTWNVATETFDVSSYEQSEPTTVSQPPSVKPHEGAPPQGYAGFRVVGDDEGPTRKIAIVDSRTYVTVDFFNDDGSLATSQNYFYVNGEYWYQDSNGIWYSTPNFTYGSFTAHTSPPPSNATPPPHREGGNDQNQQ